MVSLVKISVVIPSLNEEKYMVKTLPGFKKQTFKDFEIIVVDHSSTDNTAKIAAKYGRVINEPRPGIGLARNTGARHAKGSILVFIDADTKPSPRLLEEYNSIFDKKEIVAATGPILPLEKTTKSMMYGYKFVSIFLIKLSILLNRPSMVGSNVAVRKSAFDKVKGFNEKLKTYEDWDFSGRIRKLGKTAYLNGAVVYASTRRVKEWGIKGYALYHISNIFKYKIQKEAREDYNPIR